MFDHGLHSWISWINSIQEFIQREMNDIFLFKWYLSCFQISFVMWILKFENRYQFFYLAQGISETLVVSQETSKGK